MIWVSIFGLGVCVSLISAVGFYLCVSDTAKSFCFGGFVSIDTGGGTVALVSKIPHVCLTIRMQPRPTHHLPCIKITRRTEYASSSATPADMKIKHYWTGRCAIRSGQAAERRSASHRTHEPSVLGFLGEEKQNKKMKSPKAWTPRYAYFLKPVRTTFACTHRKPTGGYQYLVPRKQLGQCS